MTRCSLATQENLAFLRAFTQDRPQAAKVLTATMFAVNGGGVMIELVTVYSSQQLHMSGFQVDRCAPSTWVHLTA